MDSNPPGFSVHGILQAWITGVGGYALLQRIFPTWVQLQADTLPSELQGKCIYVELKKTLKS